MRLYAWLGITDLKAAGSDPAAGLGPIAQAVMSGDFSDVHLISDHPSEKNDFYGAWLRGETGHSPVIHKAVLSSPTHFRDIHSAVTKALGPAKSSANERSYHLSPGTPAMATIWILLSRSSHPGRLIQTEAKKSGYQIVEFPFDLWAELREEASSAANDELVRLTRGLPPAAPEFTDIVHRSKEMRRAVALARRLAIHDVPVLIQGESGTGKELFARAIHASSRRMEAPFVAVNCGAIPRELFESEFFGHKKGSFTGAIEDRVGFLLQGNRGTVFLDEIGELPKEMQVKLLRTLQEGRVRPVGGRKEEALDVRVLAATNRNLLSDVASGHFREDLFHRLAVGVLTLPPLRARGEDVGLLIDHALARINTEAVAVPGWEDKKLSPSARSLLLQQPWRGNIRELMNTLSRAAIWTTGTTIGIETVRECLFASPDPDGSEATVLNRCFGNDLDLPAILSDVARHYLERAMKEADGNKTLAAKLVGLPSYQTLTNWLKRYGLE